MTHFTLEMADRANRMHNADLRRRNAKLKRLCPNPSPYTNLYSPMLDFQEGDPETTDQFMDDPPLPPLPLGLGRGFYPPIG